MDEKSILVIGGGAAGYFAAIAAAEKNPGYRVVIAEAGGRPLQKVAISGGGRCNVTHACFDDRKLIEAYPRGSKELRGAFSKFQPQDTIKWFEERGVDLKVEADGRVFPTSDKSETIINCLERSREAAGVMLRLKTKVCSIEVTTDSKFSVSFKSDSGAFKELYDKVLLASGGVKGGYEIAGSLGHLIEPCVPSLFTFEISDRRLEGLSGLSVGRATLTLRVGEAKPFKDKGPLLITHWGLSGPAVIRLSAWAARELFNSNYQAELIVNYCSEAESERFADWIADCRSKQAKKQVQKTPYSVVPRRLWERLCELSAIGSDTKFSELTKQALKSLEKELFSGCYQVTGKGQFKEEFVTCGGVSLKEVDMRTMESKLVKNLFFAGEVLDIDGITGGFNFQNAWTTSYIAASSM